MKKDIAFLAVGQAGGNIGNLFEALNFKVMYINTSMEDLMTLFGAKHKYHITGGEGAAKNRNMAKDLLIADIQELQAEILKTITEEFIFVIFSAGGGTGSGIGPMLMAGLSKLFPERKVCGITILPSARESIKSLYNAVECFKDIVKFDKENLDTGCLFVIDNNGKPDKFALNDVFVDHFMSMLKLPNYIDSRGNIDTKDLKEILSAKGCIIISTLPNGQNSTPRLIDSLKNGIFARSEDDGIVRCIALSLVSEINTDAFVKIIGRPWDLFQGYNREETICVLSGLSLPYTTLTGLEALVSEVQTAMKKIWDAPKPTLLQNDIDLFFTDEAHGFNEL